MVENVIETIETDIKNDLYTASEELKLYIEELQEISFGLKVSHKILKIDQLFKDLEESKNSNDYLEIMNLTMKIKSLINDSTDKNFNLLECYQNIKIKYHIESEILLHNLKQRFEELIQFNEKLFQNTKSIIIKITKDTVELKKVIIALLNAKYNPTKLCTFLIENVFQPIVRKPVSIQLIDYDNKNNHNDDNVIQVTTATVAVSRSSSDGGDGNNINKTTAAADVISNYTTNRLFVQLRLSFSLKDLGEDLRPNYKTVFRNIKTVIQCLNHMNIRITNKISVLQIFGENMKEKLLNLIVNECIMYSIPDTIDEMNESTLVHDILEFDEFLQKSLFLNNDDANDKMATVMTADDIDLRKYAEKMDILFRNRFCSNILVNAIEIMKKDLHDMTIIAAENHTNTNLNVSITTVIGGPSASPLKFSRCMVSKSINELIALMENVLRQTSNADVETSEQLLSTIPTILTHYLDELPIFHEKLLLNIPQQTALFYNNCNYLAYWLQINCCKNIESIPKFVHALQHLSDELLTSQITNQHSQLMEILQGFDLSDATISELGIGPKNIVRQCLRQLDLLKNVWQTVLPDFVYNKTMANLLNDFCSEILRKISAVEDLPTSVSDGLIEICTTIIERAPTLFHDKHQIYEVKTWMKLTQMKMILGASLVEITEQWSGSKGPLTMNFKAEEVKHLIRALFQNTDHRANALASIV